MKRILSSIALATLALGVNAQSWPTVTPEAKPGTRWWWLGSAVDKENLTWNLSEYGKHGIGAIEITPLYGVQGNQENNIPYLSDKWFTMLRHTMNQAERNGIEVDMATGTGWPFGGPWVPLEESASKMMFVDSIMSPEAAKNITLTLPQKDQKNSQFVLQKIFPQANGKVRVIALYAKYGVMRVKRAAPGGEGLVIDHFDKTAVANYLRHIEQAFERTKTPYPHTFFNDSYEVEAATWTPTLLKEFEKRRGYKLEDHLPELIAYEPKVLSDYRETLGDLLLENFTNQWTAWAHSHGAITRNQAHGSPANLIDCYAAVDIPEIEGFGLSELGIKGLRKDPGKTRKNDSDFSMLKYAPSAAHICGKPYTSSETFTWLTEHFRTSLSQLKPDIDLMFCAGVNHMFFHGTCYSPKDDEWPGWKFYASIDMSPTNSIWRDAPYFMDYVTRCQSFLQMGQPDNDFLVLLPVRDAWKKNTGKLLMQFSIHAMGKLMPEFRQAILDIDRAGYDCDYISERLLLSTKFQNGRLVTQGGTSYKGLIIPGSGQMPENVKKHIDALKAQGAPILYGINEKEMSQVAKAEAMKTQLGLKAIRRKNANGYHYFIANLTPNDVYDYVTLPINYEDAVWFNPLNGNRYAAKQQGKQILVNLRSGESLILQTFDEALPLNDKGEMINDKGCDTIVVDGPWTLSFINEAPEVGKTYKLEKLQTWETLDEKTRVTMGTGIYTTHLKLKKKDLKDAQTWKIDLGDVRESARVYINDEFVGCAWSVPYVLDCGNTLKEGENTIRIEVTNLPANRIRELDRQGIKWRKMEEINVVDINYKKTTYEEWPLVESGLNSNVKILRY